MSEPAPEQCDECIHRDLCLYIVIKMRNCSSFKNRELPREV